MVDFLSARELPVTTWR